VHPYAVLCKVTQHNTLIKNIFNQGLKAALNDSCIHMPHWQFNLSLPTARVQPALADGTRPSKWLSAGAVGQMPYLCGRLTSATGTKHIFLSVKLYHATLIQNHDLVDSSNRAWPVGHYNHRAASSPKVGDYPFKGIVACTV
jgi:hypothetical protein